jgi:hypothetical protein
LKAATLAHLVEQLYLINTIAVAGGFAEALAACPNEKVVKGKRSGQ